MTSDVAGDVRAANEAFYRAFESLDLPEMERVWAHEDRVACVHPGWPGLHGWTPVRDSWAAIFHHTPEIRFAITDTRVACAGELAWVTCVENIVSRVDGGLAAAAVVATNVFERRGGRWLMVHHHASPFVARPAGPDPDPA